jgi:hypothetical protein
MFFLSFKKILSPIYLFIYIGAGDGIQGLVHARQSALPPPNQAPAVVMGCHLCWYGLTYFKSLSLFAPIQCKYLQIGTCPLFLLYLFSHLYFLFFHKNYFPSKLFIEA